MILFPNAKINLGLNVCQKRNDGFHNLETVMIPIPVYDILEITEAKKFEFVQSGELFDNYIEDNLCVRAYHLIAEIYDIPPVRIHLRKQIPMGAGLGGGSADAAFVVKALNDLFHLTISLSEQQKLVSNLGSDCAFFIKNVPQIATGRGEILKPINLDLHTLTIHLVFPKIRINTSQAFAGVHISGDCGTLESDILKPVSNWQSTIKNDFEPHIFEMHPILSKYKHDLVKQGALFAGMSGSGSTIFGIFDSNHSIIEQQMENTMNISLDMSL